MLPNFLIIGAPRAGTTWIQENIKHHPEIYMPEQKELHFFNRYYEKGMDYYRSFFDGVKPEHKAIGEATPDYLHHVGIENMIKENLGDVKMIVSLRNPVDRVYSRYWNSKAKFAHNKNLTFEEKIEQKPEFIEEGYYYRHLMRYMEVFPKENFLILLFDDLEKDKSNFLRRIYDFLEIDPEFVSPIPPEHKVNTAASKPSLGKSRVLYYTSKVARRLHLSDLAYKLEKINITDLPEMNPKTRKWLVNDVYRFENDKLGKLIGRDLSHWNR